MEYVSPGDAFSSSFENSLLQRAAMQRQSQMDQIAMQREDRQRRHDEDEMAQAKDALAEKRRAFNETQTDKQKQAFEKSLSTMLPGDIPSPEMVEASKKFGYGHLFPEAAPPAPAPVAAPVAAPSQDPTQDPAFTGGPSDAPADVATPPPPDAMALPPQPKGVRFLGSPAQRTDVAQRAATKTYMESLPADSPERMALNYELQTGKNAPAGAFARNDDGQPIARVDAKRQVVQRLQNGVWTDVAGDVPKGTHFIQEPAAPSTSGADAAKEGARNRAYTTANTELNKTAAPFEGQLANLQAAREVLLERSPSGDAHVAPMILKALVAGQGSGFRMTKAEIDQVQNARTKWQSMEATFRKWSLDPKDALFFDDAQRADFARLLGTVEKAAARHLDKVNKVRFDINDLDNPRDIQRRVSGLHTELTTKDEDGPDADKPKPKAADLWKQYATPPGKK